MTKNLSRRTRLVFARVLGAGFLTLLAAGTTRLHAQTNSLSDSRYLLIFDTSAGMKRRVENVQRVAGDLLSSGMNGQLRPGDSIGVWTYNESLYAGAVPLMRWAPERRASIAAKVTEFLRNQKFEKASRPESFIPAVNQLVTNSPRLTVVIFSDGVSPLNGTPFDAEINAAYEPFRANQKAERMPFVTVLRAKRGEYLGHAVTPAPWAVEFPQFPPAPVSIKPVTERKPETPRTAVPPLIVIGKKSDNPAPSVELPQPTSEPKAPPSPQPLSEAEKLFARLAAERGIPIEPATNPTPTKPEPTPAATTLPPPAAAPPQERPKPTSPPIEKSAPPAPPAATPPPTTTVSNPPVSSTLPPPALAAVTSPPATPSNNVWLLLVGGGGIVFGTLLTYALLRRRQRAHVSLITSSMDRRQK